MPDPDTIFAHATPATPSPVALIRISGASCAAICKVLCAAEFKRASVDCRISLPLGEVPAAAWLLPGPATLTGDDTLELRIPGNLAIVRELEDRLRALGARDAEPGEFTRRALDAGKLDFSRAEAVLQLINATDEVSRRQAVVDLSGESATRIGALAEHLRSLSARFEMSFDFSEEEHAESLEQRLYADLREFVSGLRSFVGADDPAPRLLRPVIALFGPPNAGKSTLFNVLLGTPRALVSSTPGTTRDPVEADLLLGDHVARIADLSGVGGSDMDVGRFAEAARARAMQAHVLLLLCPPEGSEEVIEEFEELQRRDAGVRSRAMWVRTKSDLPLEQRGNPAGLEEVSLSAISGAGLDDLRSRLGTRLDQAASGGATSLLRVRSAAALVLLEQATADPDAPHEVVASDVRRALTALDEALMAEAPGEVLDLIFSRFCIGK
ncbi:MAG: 50S ribosome-binding GTPase [Planctomycetes bacterium]|nr:50S ribosome-binding GTPase [Planctomycetota bacterium]